jgi:outer membrane immunogenic protein
MLKKFLLAGIASIALCGVAQAADIVEPTVYDWTGPYIGIQGGYAWGTNDVDVDIPGLAAGVAAAQDVVLFPPDDGGEIDIDGWLGGLHLGYLWQHDSLVFGIEGDGEFADIDGDTDVQEFKGGPDIGSLEQEIDWLASLRLRLGFAMDRALIYATGGLAVGGVEFSGDVFGSSDSEDSTEWGWTVGGGLEYAFTDELSARVEYRYTDLGDTDLTLSRFDFDVDNTFHAVRVGLSWHFGAI